MSSIEPDVPSLLDFAKEEIKAQAIILRESLVGMKGSQKNAEFLEVALKSVQTIVQVVNSRYFVVLRPLVQVLEYYFQAIQRGMAITQAHLEVLSIVIGELTRVADINKSVLEKTLLQKQTTFDQLTLQLKQFIAQFEANQPVNISPKAAQIESSLAATLTKDDQNFLTLFLQDLATQVSLLQQQVKSLQQTQTIETLDAMIKVVQTIKQSGKIIQLNLVVESGLAIEEYLLAMKDKRAQWSAQGQQVLKKILDFFSELSRLPADHVSFFMQDRSEELLDLVQQLQILQGQLQKTKQLKSEKVKETKNSSEGLSSHFSDVIIDPTMFDLFCVELESQCAALNNGLIALEQDPQDEKILESLMRAAHSIKGAARVVSLTPIVHLAHALEDWFVAAQKHQIELQADQFDQLLRGVDLLTRLSKISLQEVNSWLREQLPLIEALVKEMTTSPPPSSGQEAKKSLSPQQLFATESAGSIDLGSKKITKAPSKKIGIKIPKAFQTSFTHDRVLRVTAQNLNRLMGLAGESLVESRWLYPFVEALIRLKKHQNALAESFDQLRDSLREEKMNELTQHCLTDLQNQLNEGRHQLNDRLGELDDFIRRHASLSDRLYQEVINSRMRPFADGVEAFPRMIRDLARQLGKRVKLEIEGKSTPVDRDILEKLESPLSHLLRNAVDHGIELPAERQAAGKSPEGVIKLEARHRGGMLAITVSDDGRGIDIEQLRQKIVEKNLISAEMASRLTDSEVVDFLFLPGFSTSHQVTEISGRGVGLDIVQSAVQEVGGVVRTVFTPGKGMVFHLQLPLTLSVIRALLVEISGEAYAFPLARIDQVFLLNRERIDAIENRQFFHYEGQNIGLVPAWQVLELSEPLLKLTQIPVIILKDRLNSYGLVVDRLIGEKELVVQELDSRLGKVADVIAGALMEDGAPVLIIDVEDIVRSIDNLLSGGRLMRVAYTKDTEVVQPRKRVLVVDDSITVREVECRLLQNQGYEVETAVNGIDGWNAVRIGHYDLVVTDVDMPRMNGIELVRAIKGDERLHNLPVMIVSYKEGEADRLLGLEAGADYYLTKSSFHDATLLNAVYDLIGQP